MSGDGHAQRIQKKGDFGEGENSHNFETGK